MRVREGAGRQAGRQRRSLARLGLALLSQPNSNPKQKPRPRTIHLRNSDSAKAEGGGREEGVSLHSGVWRTYVVQDCRDRLAALHSMSRRQAARQSPLSPPRVSLPSLSRTQRRGDATIYCSTGDCTRTWQRGCHRRACARCPGTWGGPTEAKRAKQHRRVD